MDVVIIILLCIFAGVALMVILGERFAKPMEPEQLQSITRWIAPLIVLMIVLSIINYFFS